MGNDRRRIGLREVRGLSPHQIIWDSAVAGFGARRQTGMAISYFIKYRTKDGRQRWHKIGRHGAPWTPERAREEALRVLGEVAGGGDPAGDRQTSREAKTMAELCDLYFRDAVAGRVLTRKGESKKDSTLAIDRGRIERHIKPLLGAMKVAAVSRHDVDRFMHDVAEGKTAVKARTDKRRGLARVTGGRTAATRAVGLLGAIFTYAIRHRMRPDNPAHGIQRFADNKRERRLSDAEYKALGEALRKAEAEVMWPPAVAAARFLALTGWRTSEVVALQRSNIDSARRTAVLLDTKGGRSMRPLSIAACDVLNSGIPMNGARVFAPTRGGQDTLLHFKKIWPRILKLGGLPADITPHVLRHSFASLAADLGYGESTIAAMVGHKGRSITSRYVHSADSVLLAAVDAVANRIIELMGDEQCLQTAAVREISINVS